MEDKKCGNVGRISACGQKIFTTEEITGKPADDHLFREQDSVPDLELNRFIITCSQKICRWGPMEDLAERGKPAREA